ncbi:MAG: hypothetical protein K2O29_08295 [Ruminococcus sp.]|nr:hypothetical protein [Ruminococcus sp.]MDE6849353.1 hypothetical protein [Ruminococcus sp.]MDE7138439.1 hypothetical protein [Ruminococcus sp.]
MIDSIIREIIEKLSQNGVTPVYHAFDAVSVEKKNRGFFTVVNVGSFELQTPIYSEFTAFLPYKADIDISVTAPENYRMEKLYGYFSDNVQPAVMKFSGMNCSLRRVSIKHDSNINRFVLTARLSVSGMNKFERSSE